MSTNIVIGSDGTGNTAIKGRGTNVFKLYEAVDLRDLALPKPIAFYDDGAGTEDFKSPAFPKPLRPWRSALPHPAAPDGPYGWVHSSWCCWYGVLSWCQNPVVAAQPGRAVSVQRPEDAQ